MQNDPAPATTTSPRPRARRRTALAALALAGGLAGVAGAPPLAAASTTATTCVATSRPTDWKSALTAANTALAKALTHLQHEQFHKAAKQLRVMERQSVTANTAATRLIGKPPTDPESDDPPGVTAVLKVSGLDHKITMTLVPLFGDPNGHRVIAPLGKGLKTVEACRESMLGTVIALKPAARDDYVDGLSDTLAVYPKELTAFTAALAGDSLTPAGATALLDAQDMVSTTEAAMEGVFGGGERSPR